MVETVTDFAARAKKSGRIYAALYELGDEQLIVALEGLGNRLDIVLSNSVVTDEKTKEEDGRQRERAEPAKGHGEDGGGPDHAVEPHRAQQVSRTRRQRQGEVRPLRIDELDVDCLCAQTNNTLVVDDRSWQTATGTIGRQSPPTRTTLRGREESAGGETPRLRRKR